MVTISWSRRGYGHDDSTADLQELQLSLDAWDFYVDIYSPADARGVGIGEFDWTQLGRNLTEVLEWVGLYEVSCLAPAQTEQAWAG